jgi:voltage-gated potassium channel
VTSRTGKIEDRLERAFTRRPTIRTAGVLIVVATVLTVVISGALMRVFDRAEFPSIWLGMWWALQTVTTVGYGDVVPKRLSGRIVALAVMLQGIAFLAVMTAVITSSFMERARRRGGPDESHSVTHAALADVAERLERIERSLESRL